LKNKLVIISAIISLLTSCNKKQDLNAIYENKTTKSSATAQATSLIPGGLVDNTLMLQALLDDNNRTTFQQEGTYLTSQLTVHSYDTIIMGSNFKLLLDPLVTMQPVLYFPAGTHDVYIKGGILDANWQNNAIGSQLECIKMDQGCYNITIDSVTVNNAKDYGAIQIKGVSGALCRNIRLRDIISKQTGRTVIECRGVDKVIIRRPDLEHWGQQNPNSPAIQFQSVPSHNVQIYAPVTKGFEGSQFAIESAAANVDSVYISRGSFTDNTNAGNNGISGYFTNATFNSCTMVGGVGSQRSGYEIFGSNNTIDHPVVTRGIIAISTGSVTNSNASNIKILYPDVTSGGTNNSALDLGSYNGLVLSNVTITGGKLDTRNATGNSSAFTFGYYGGLGIVQNVTMNNTQLYSGTSAVRIQAADGSKGLVLNQVDFMQQTQQVSDVTQNVNYTINP
jgi:hypothetical protein